MYYLYFVNKTNLKPTKMKTTKSTIKSFINKNIDNLFINVKSSFDGMTDCCESLHEGFKKVNERIDKIGLSVANLEDDAPTIEEFDKLEVRVTDLEQRAISI